MTFINITFIFRSKSGVDLIEFVGIYLWTMSLATEPTLLILCPILLIKGIISNLWNLLIATQTLIFHPRQVDKAKRLKKMERLQILCNWNKEDTHFFSSVWGHVFNKKRSITTSILSFMDRMTLAHFYLSATSFSSPFQF